MDSIRLQQALDQLRDVRRYTLRLIDDVAHDEWFAMPGGVSHIAWQVGHLAMAQYRICIARIRGVLPGDDEILPPAYMTLFGIGSTPHADAAQYPTPSEIRSVLDRVDASAQLVCANLAEADLDAEVCLPHPLFNTKLGSLLWGARHEMLHAGQIGLLRRLAGKKPLW